MWRPKTHRHSKSQLLPYIKSKVFEAKLDRNDALISRDNPTVINSELFRMEGQSAESLQSASIAYSALSRSLKIPYWIQSRTVEVETA